MGKNKRKPGGYQREKLAIEHTGFYPYLRDYLESRLINNYSAETNRRHDSNVRKFIVWCDDRNVDDPRSITKPILERYKKHLYYSRKSNGDPLSFNGQATVLSSIKGFFKWLTQQNYLLYNPASELQLPKKPNQLPRNLLSLEETQDLLNSANVQTVEGIRDRAVMELLYSCGLRRQECANLALHDIDMKRQTLFVREGKGGKDRVLPIGDSATGWLIKYLDDARPELIIDVNEYSLFISDYGEAYQGAGIGRLVKRAMKKANIEKEGSAHLFRHAMATHMLENGADIRFIQAMLGHSDLKSTQVYTRVSIEKLREIHKATHPAKGGINTPLLTDNPL